MSVPLVDGTGAHHRISNYSDTIIDWPKGPTTLGNGWLFGNLHENGQGPAVLWTMELLISGMDNRVKNNFFRLLAIVIANHLKVWFGHLAKLGGHKATIITSFLSSAPIVKKALHPVDCSCV